MRRYRTPLKAIPSRKSNLALARQACGVTDHTIRSVPIPRGAAAYDESYADTRRWVEQGLLDYIAPPNLLAVLTECTARYDVLAKWWADVVKPTRTRLYIGIAFYKVGEPSKIEPDWMISGGVPELKKQLDLNDAVPEISGTILFREDYLNHRLNKRSAICKVVGAVKLPFLLCNKPVFPPGLLPS